MSSRGPGRDGDEVIGLVTSADGTTIGYRTFGRGPGVVVLHGALESSADYADLAKALAGSLTVHVLDRRGRGYSGPHGADHGLAVEVEDVRAVVRATGARRLFGVSSGGVIALHAALDLPGVRQVAVYEPALTIPGEDTGAEAYIARYEGAVARGDTVEAILAVLKGTRVGPPWLRALPRPVARRLVRRLVADDAEGGGEGGADGEVTFGSLVPTMRYDFRVAEEGSADLFRFTALRSQVLLVGGSRSPRYLDAALAVLDGLLPDARRVRLPRAGHTASANRREGGRPDLVARALLAFFGGEPGGRSSGLWRRSHEK